MHPRLKKQLATAGLSAEEFADSRWHKFIAEIDEHYSREEERPAGPRTDDLGMLEAVLDSIPGYVSWVSYDLHYLGVNQGLASAFGLDRQDFAGKPIGFRNPESPFVKFIAQFFASNAQSEQCVSQIPFAREARWYFLIARKYNNGRAAVIIGLDITQVKQNEETIVRQESQLAASAKLAELGQLAAIIAHEVNNPLGVILGNSQILRRTLTRDPIDRQKADEVAERIELTAVRIAKIIRGCRTFSREGSSDPFQTATLGTIIDESIEMVKPQFAAQGTKLIHAETSTKAVMRCRPTQISQVIVNLLNNALDAVDGRRDRWVRLDVEENETHIALKVTDSGNGIPTDVAAKIFNPFFTTKPVNKGTGLGLSICAGIIRDHGGEIKLDLGAPNTTFEIRLPKHLAQSLGPSHQGPASGGGQS